jgi:hypothetical protein
LPAAKLRLSRKRIRAIPAGFWRARAGNLRALCSMPRVTDAPGVALPFRSAKSGGRGHGRSRRLLLVVVGLVGLLAFGLLVAAGVVLERRHEDYGAFFPGRTPERLTYCGGRHYLRGGPLARATAESESGALVAVGRTPGGATLFAPVRRDIVAGKTICPIIVWVGNAADAQLVNYVLSGGP